MPPRSPQRGDLLLGFFLGFIFAGALCVAFFADNTRPALPEPIVLGPGRHIIVVKE
jgi:hypothetical protein